MHKKILFFIENLRSGGKERRMVELLYYLKSHTNYEMHVVLTEDDVDYKYIYDLGIPVTVIKRRWLKKDPIMFFRFFKIAKQFRPDIIHTWGIMTTFYAIPSKLILGRPIFANLISDAQKGYRCSSLTNFFFKIDCYFSNRIIGNSNAGFLAYGVNSNKKRLIYNGVRLERFKITANKQDIRYNIGINSKYMVIMVASMSKKKDYDLFLDVAKEAAYLNSDITFVAVGNGSEYNHIQNRIRNEKIKNIITLGQRDDVETLIYVSDLGVLFTHSEGISNTIIEYMAMGKPVITTDKNGGSKEVIEESVSGYIVEKDAKIILSLILKILADESLRISMGTKGKEFINSKFAIERMGQEFDNQYKEILGVL